MTHPASKYCTSLPTFPLTHLMVYLWSTSLESTDRLVRYFGVLHQSYWINRCSTPGMRLRNVNVFTRKCERIYRILCQDRYTCHWHLVAGSIGIVDSVAWDGCGPSEAGRSSRRRGSSKREGGRDTGSGVGTSRLLPGVFLCGDPPSQTAACSQARSRLPPWSMRLLAQMCYRPGFR